MAWQGSLAFSPGERLTSLKMSQLVENLRAHDHRFDGTQGPPVVRWQIGQGTEVRGGSGFVITPITFSVFDPNGPVPQVLLAIDQPNLIGTVVTPWGVQAITRTGADVRISRTNATNTVFRWLAVQAPA